MTNVADNFFSSVRTRSIVEPEFIYNRKQELNSVPESLRMDFSRILNKPFFLRNAAWSTTANAFSLLTTVKIPSDLLLNELAKVPFKSSVLYRCKITLLLQVSGTPMHQGTLVAASFPIETGPEVTATTAINKTFINSMMSAPHVFLSANESTPAALEVPFYVNGKLDKCDLLDNTINPYNFGINYAEASIMVLNPLIAPTSGSASLSVSIYAMFTDMDFYVPHVDVTFITPTQPTDDDDGFKPEGLVEELSSKASTAIDGVFSVAKRFTGDLFDIGRKGIKALTGLHNPNNPSLSAKMHVQNRQLCNVTDKPVQFEKLDPFQNYDRLARDYIFDTAIDEMDLHYVLSKPQYLGTFQVTTTDASGTLCWSRPITPSQQVDETSYLDAQNGITYNTIMYNNLMQIFANMSRYWKGSIKIHLQSVMTNFHFCKLTLARDYSPVAASIGGFPSFNSVQNLLVETMEFSAGGQVQTVELPFCSALNQLPVSTDWIMNAASHGLYYVYLSQPLVTNGSVSPSISFNVYISAGDDFQLFGYSVDPRQIYIPLVSDAVPIAALETFRKGKSSEELKKEEAIAQEQLAKDLLLDFTTESMAPTVINDQQDLLIDTSKDKQNEVVDCVDLRPIVSVRDYTRRFYKIDEYVWNGTSAAQNYGVQRIDVASLIGVRGFLTSNVTSSCDTLAQIASMFHGFCGGVRLKLVVRGSNSATAWYIPPGFAVSQLANTDVAWRGTVPCNPINLGASSRLDMFDQYANIIEEIGTSAEFYHFCQSVQQELPNYSTFGNSEQNGATLPANKFVAGTTTLLEFEIPNISPYRFLGDSSKNKRVTSFFRQNTCTTNLGHIMLWTGVPLLSAEATSTPSVTYFDVYACVDDMARYGFQVSTPNIMLVGAKNNATPARDLQLSSFGNAAGGVNLPPLPDARPGNTLRASAYFTKT